MKNTARFTVSMTTAEFRELESRRRRTGLTRSRILRDALSLLNSEKRPASEVREGGADYQPEKMRELIDPRERRRRAVAAAGRFRSDATELSENHDRHFAEASEPEKSSGLGRKE